MRRALPLATGLVLCGTPSLVRAGALPDCATLPAPLFVPGTTDVKPLLARVAPKLATATGDDQVTIVYQGMGSCSALDYVLTGTDLMGTASYWDGAEVAGVPVEKSCTIAAGTQAQLALSDVSVQTCTGVAPPADVAEVSSVAQGFGFVVPEGSSNRAITATEGYFLFKFGGEDTRQVPPWTNPALVVIRTPAASTQLLTGLAVGVLGTQWSAALTNINTGSSDVIAKVAAEATTGNRDTTIGILSLQRYDGARAQVDLLAFESFGQACLGAVYPDSTATALDKRNLRDGHYSIWGYLWAVGLADQGRAGTLADTRARRFAEFLRGTTTVNGADPIGDAARAGAVPACAMHVRREFDGAPLTASEPAAPCDCAFEAAATGASTCTACDDGSPCATGVCRAGYCEVR